MAPAHLLPKKLRTVRRAKNLTLQEVSQQTGIPVQSLSVYERGEVEAPMHRIVQLAALYTVSLDYLFNLPPRTTPVLLLVCAGILT